MATEIEECGSALFLALPVDVLALISAHLRPRDLCALALCCRGLRAAIDESEKAWLAQCCRLGPPSHVLLRWRSAIGSYRSLCRFLAVVAPLLGIWVHQNPELGNVVYVFWGFLSVVGVRIIPQELGPLSLDGGPLLWAPVFEIFAGDDGAPSSFFLHGRDCGEDFVYPGSFRTMDASCNVLFLEVDVRDKPLRLNLARSFSAVTESKDPTLARKLCRSDTFVGSSPSATPPLAPTPLLLSFSKLAFSDRRRLLDLVARKIRLKVPSDLVDSPLFDRTVTCDDAQLLAGRRLELIHMHKLYGGRIDRKAATELSHLEHKCCLNGDMVNMVNEQGAINGKRRVISSVAGYLKDGFKQFINRSSSLRSHSPGSSGSKHIQVHEFIRSGDTVGLSLRAAHMRLTTYRAWPNMHDNRFALYKLPMQVPSVGQEYAGLWGGAFGWPPGRISEDKVGKALFLLLISYEEINGQLLLIATKILEGTHYVLHPNGSPMFMVRVDELTSETFPWETDGESHPVEVMQSFTGDGIANGYGFRYPGSKPGSLFVLQNGLLAFVWKESKSVLTLQRMDLLELLRKGERVPTLPPIGNFAYLTKSYSNVFTGFPTNSCCSSLPRQCLNGSLLSRKCMNKP